MILDVSVIINPLDHIYALLNDPPVKEFIKELFGWTTFVFGVSELIHLAQKGTKNVQKLVLISKFSLILSASVTRPGIFVISNISYFFIGTDQIEDIFGPYTIFMMNPWHPRHIVSFIALAFALPLTIQTLRDVFNTQNDVVEKGEWNAPLRIMTLFNTFASRPLLHLGNKLSWLVLKGS